MGNTLDQWNQRHIITKEGVDLSAWDLNKANKRVLPNNSYSGGDGTDSDPDNDGDVDVLVPKKKINGKPVA